MNFPPQIRIKRNCPLAPYTSIRIGGSAAYLAEVDDQDTFVRLYRFCRDHDIRMAVLGHGTNVFFSDEGFEGLVAVIKFDSINVGASGRVTAEAGAALSALNEACTRHGLTGCEFTAGIPGTIGGAIYGNAGAYGSSIGDVLTWARVLTAEGKVLEVENEYFQFAYRDSILKRNHAIVLEATFQFAAGDRQKIEARVNEILALRRQKLPPPDVPTAGSYFKNIENKEGRRTAAAIYLDAIGSKEISVGDVAVHPKHANIFYNKGRATARDVLTLEKILKEKVQQKFAIKLEREVIFIK